MVRAPRVHHRERGDLEIAPAQRADGVVERHLQRRRPDDQDHQRADEPAHRQPEQGAGRDHGADDEVDRHEGQQQRPPPAPPPRGQPRTRHREHRGEHRDPAGVVDELRRERVEPVRQVEVPPGGRDAVAGDRQRENGDQPGGRVRAEQFPATADDEADQDDEGQRHDRDAVDEVDQVGLGGWQNADDFGDGFLERDPSPTRDQRACDDDREEHRREDEPQDVVGPSGQRLQQAAGHGDVPSVNSHASTISRIGFRAASLSGASTT